MFAALGVFIGGGTGSVLRWLIASAPIGEP